MKVIRPQANDKKIKSIDEFELCYLRHRYLRRVDYNPSEKEMNPYMKIVNRISRKAFMYNYSLFLTVGLGREDTVNIGRVHLVSFIGLFEFKKNKNRKKYEAFCVTYMNKHKGRKPTEYDILGKNKANFTIFLKQRMEDLVRICKQKAKNIKGLRVDEYQAYYGPDKPPTELSRILEDSEFYGFKKLDNMFFRAIRKKTKANIKKPFQFAGNWYVAVPLEQRDLTLLDFSGAGLDPYENKHNLDPERLLQEQQTEITFDNNVKVFHNSPNEEKAKTIFDFIEKNGHNPQFKEEIGIAKKYLKNMGIIYVR